MYELPAYLDQPSYLQLCCASKELWNYRNQMNVGAMSHAFGICNTGDAHRKIHAIQCIMHGILPPHSRGCNVSVRKCTVQLKTWMWRCGTDLCTVTSDGHWRAMDITDKSRTTRWLSAMCSVVRLEQGLGLTVFFGFHDVIAKRGTGPGNAEVLYRLSGVQTCEIAFVSFLDSNTFVVGYGNTLVTYTWSTQLRRFVWTSRASPFTFGLMNMNTTNNHGHVLCIKTALLISTYALFVYEADQDDEVPIHCVYLPSGRAYTRMFSTADKKHALIISDTAYKTTVHVYNIERAPYEVRAIDIPYMSGCFHVHGDILHVSLNMYTSLPYNHLLIHVLSGQVTEVQTVGFDSCYIDTDICATYARPYGVCIHWNDAEEP